MARLVTSLYDVFVDYEWEDEHNRLTQDLAGYRAARSRDSGWMLGPIIVSDARVREVPEPVPVASIGKDEALRTPSSTLAAAESITLPADLVAASDRILQFAPVAYFELQRTSCADVLSAVNALRGRGSDVRLRVRSVRGRSSETGPFVPVDAMAKLLADCLAQHVPLKVFGGTQRAFRHDEGHGFVNLLAAVRAGLGGATSVMEEILADKNPTNFDIASGMWKGVGPGVHEGILRQVLRSAGTNNFSTTVAELEGANVQNAWVAS